MTLADAIQTHILWIQGITLVVQLLALIGLGLYVRYTRQLRDAANVSLHRESQALENQQLSIARQNFETKYFELIKMHRDNVAEIKVDQPRLRLAEAFLPGQTVSGRKFFVWLIRELRCALDVVHRVVEASGQTITQRDAMHIAYYCLYFGVGPNSSRMLKISLSAFDAKLIEAVETELSRTETKEKARKDRSFPYIPFEGHQSRLGHYYRHLYQMVRYVDQQNLVIHKYEYAKTMRAQLSTHEQAALLVNSITPMGQDWWLNGLIVEYRLVQNIPPGFFDGSREFDPTALFVRGYFEAEDTEPRKGPPLV